MNKPLRLFSLARLCLLGVLFYALPVYAVATFNANLKITNPGEALTSVAANFTLPACLTPTSTGAGVTWNAATQVLSIYIGNIASGETKSFPVTFQADSDGCYASGQITAELVTVESSFTNGSSGDGVNQPPVNEEVPANQEEGTPVNSEVPPEEQQQVPEELPPGLPPPEEQSTGTEQGGQPATGGGGGGGGGGGTEGGGYVSLNFLPSPVTDVVASVRSAPNVAQAVRNVVEPVTQAASAVSVTVVATNAASAGSHLLFSWLNYLRFLFLGFIRRKKVFPWGRVFNAWTQSPIGGASVSVIETTFQKVKETQTTDNEGRFGFLATPGNYYLRVSKAGFEAKETAPFNTGDNPSQLNLQIGITEQGGAVENSRVALMRFWAMFNYILYEINPYILLAGGLFSLAAFIIIPTKLNLAVLIGYVVIGVLKIILSRSSVRSYGIVLNKENHSAIPLGVVRLFNADKNWLVGTRVSDNAGRFNFLVLPGRYYLTCAKGGYSELKTNAAEIQKAGVVNQTLEMTPVVTGVQAFPPTQ